MLNENNERELCYIVKVDDIKPIEGRDRVECAVVNGWTIMVRKDQFKPGDLGIYFEIDSQVPAKEPFLFLEQKHYKIKTQKYKTPSGQFWSQGLLMSAEDFGWEKLEDCLVDKTNNLRFAEGESRFLTKEFGVTYAVEEDNSRKSNNNWKDQVLNQHKKLLKKAPIRWLMRYKLFRKIFFFIFGRKKKKTDWPAWVRRTDEERIQNMPWILQDKSEWIATEKIDGTSTTFTLKRGKRKGTYSFFVCSRNVVFDKPDKKCFYPSNVYLEMSEKYNIENVLKILLEDVMVNDEWITLQGETFGNGIQKRTYSLDDHKFYAFNLITSSHGRYNSKEAKEIVEKYGIPWVPIVDEHFILPDTVEELLNIATGESAVDGRMREGLVIRSQDGSKSFKAVSNEFLMKYHN